MLALDQTASSLSPCSPMMKACTLRPSTPSRWPSRYLSRAVSSTVPEPITRPAGRPESRCAMQVSTSTGLDTTSSTASRAACTTCPTTADRMVRLRPSSATRVSPGRWLAPAARMTSPAAGEVAVIARPDMTGLGERNAVVDVRGLALGLLPVDVHQHDLGKQPGDRQRIGAACAHKADAHHAAFLHIAHCFSTPLRFPVVCPFCSWKTPGDVVQ